MVINDVNHIQVALGVKPEQIKPVILLFGKVGAAQSKDQANWIARQTETVSVGPYKGFPRYRFVGEHGYGVTTQTIYGLFSGGVSSLALANTGLVTHGTIMFDTLLVIGATTNDYLPLYGFEVDLQPPK